MFSLQGLWGPVRLSLWGGCSHSAFSQIQPRNREVRGNFFLSPCTPSWAVIIVEALTTGVALRRRMKRTNNHKFISSGMQASTSSWRVTLQAHSPLVASLQVMPKHRTALFTCKSGAKTTMWPQGPDTAWVRPTASQDYKQGMQPTLQAPLLICKVQMQQKLPGFPYKSCLWNAF